MSCAICGATCTCQPEIPCSCHRRHVRKVLSTIPSENSDEIRAGLQIHLREIQPQNGDRP